MTPRGERGTTSDDARLHHEEGEPGPHREVREDSEAGARSRERSLNARLQRRESRRTRAHAGRVQELESSRASLPGRTRAEEEAPLLQHLPPPREARLVCEEERSAEDSSSPGRLRPERRGEERTGHSDVTPEHLSEALTEHAQTRHGDTVVPLDRPAAAGHLEPLEDPEHVEETREGGWNRERTHETGQGDDPRSLPEAGEGAHLAEDPVEGVERAVPHRASSVDAPVIQVRHSPRVRDVHPEREGEELRRTSPGKTTEDSVREEDHARRVPQEKEETVEGPAGAGPSKKERRLLDRGSSLDPRSATASRRRALERLRRARHLSSRSRGSRGRRLHGSRALRGRSLRPRRSLRCTSGRRRHRRTSRSTRTDLLRNRSNLLERRLDVLEELRVHRERSDPGSLHASGLSSLQLEHPGLSSRSTLESRLGTSSRLSRRSASSSSLLLQAERLSSLRRLSLRRRCSRGSEATGLRGDELERAEEDERRERSDALGEEGRASVVHVHDDGDDDESTDEEERERRTAVILLREGPDDRRTADDPTVDHDRDEPPEVPGNSPDLDGDVTKSHVREGERGHPHDEARHRS